MPTSPPRIDHRPISSSRDRQTNPDVATANAVLEGKAALGLDGLRSLVKALKTARYFDLAWQIAARGRRSSAKTTDDAIFFSQQQALCTYKDPDLPADQRLDDALKILREDLDLGSTTNQETLGLAGGIFKRKWEINGLREELERSLAYYLRGSKQGVADDGYTAINAAFILDLLIAQEEAAAIESGIANDATARRDEARKIREEVVTTLAKKVKEQRQQGEVKNPWFLLGTLGEAEFGLGHYKEALVWLKQALEHQPADWEYETTARQLAAIAHLHTKQSGGPEHPAWQTLRKFLGDDAVAANSIRIGKVGLSLSGGGFRASLFHIGVLARLAECDLLRHVEVLSCVSGGSIVGAHYYLEVRHLLQTKKDSEITRADYVEIVKRIADTFLRGIQRNLRCRLTSEFTTNLKMALVPDYSTTQRLGELYEEEIYALVKDDNSGARWLDELIVVPKGEGTEFTPKLDNWRRSAKVPILVLNATALNTGHNWQFTASWMGETPSGITSEIEANDRLRRLYYWQAPEGHRKMRLGHAVAASACVPGLFEPLALTGIYQDRIVHLVDGGLHDNQGVASLLEQDCAIFLVSDATGQMQTVRKPRSELVGLLMRTSSILMARVREAEYRELESRRRASLIRGLMFLHLKKGLDFKAVDWIDAPKLARQADEDSESDSTTTKYGVDKAAQEQLAAIRTDLDSFNDTEALALMASGYLMTKHELPRTFRNVAGLSTNEASGNWRFLEVARRLADQHADGRAHFMRLLKVGCSAFGKPFRLGFFRSVLAFGLPLIALLAVIAGTIKWACSRPPGTFPGWIGWTFVATAATLAIYLAFLFFMRRKSITQFAFGLLFAIVGWIAWIHILTTDRIYLHLGRMPQAPHQD